MKRLLALLLVLAAPLSFADQNLTKDSVTALLQQVTQAANAKDLDTLSRYLSEDFKVEIEVPQAPEENVSMDLTEYREAVAATWALAEQYSIEVKIDEVSILDGGQRAVARSRVSETLLVEGENLNTESREELQVQLRDGAPRITHVKAIVDL
ncbi:nuclear transport factor 2 family protein [Pseudomonas mangrovi]|jgi:ketosteroid isomerase-like protein|nr:nuclear transport factor 2 family protein [Pseudomonas mangrovi]